MHPLINDLSILSDNILHEKIVDLTKKYWQCNNPNVQIQISMAIDSYKHEIEIRKKNKKSDETDLDNLIKIS